jgi:transcriptional antiterminator NusG
MTEGDVTNQTETETTDPSEAQLGTDTTDAEAAVSEEIAAPEEVAADAEPEVSANGEVATVESEPSGDAEISDDAESEDDEDEEEDYFFAPGDWYVVHTYAGYENKVKANLASRIQSMNMEDKIYDVVVPTEEVMELKSGKMQAVQKKVFPGYILVRMELDDDSWYVVRNTPGVTGFVGSGAKPTPLDALEVSKILAPKTEDRPKPKLEYEVGEVVSVVGGAFAGYSGPVNAIDSDKQRVTVLLDLFGRETPVELTFDQVTKL